MLALKLTYAAVIAAVAVSPALATDAVDGAVKPMSLKDCGAKYQAAKTDGSLKGRKWMDYRAAECGIAMKPRQAPVRSEAAKSEAMRRLVFPATLAAEFTSEKPWTARMRTCLKSYREAKQAGTLFGVKWVEKGGGYYSMCSAKLRAGA